MKLIYIGENKVQEKATMEKPDRKEYFGGIKGQLPTGYRKAMEAYNEHTSSLKTYDLIGEHTLKVGDEVEVEIRRKLFISGGLVSSKKIGRKGLQTHYSEYAVLIPPKEESKEIKKGDKVKCLYKDSGHKFWHEQFEKGLTVKEVYLKENIPNQLKFEEIPNQLFYANDFKTVTQPNIPKEQAEEKDVKSAEAILQDVSGFNRNNTIDHQLILKAMEEYASQFKSDQSKEQ